MENLSGGRIQSFRYAFAGFRHVLKTGHNFQIQVLIGLVAVLLAFYFQFSRFEWLVLLLIIAFVLISELFNTVIEVVVDLAVKEKLIPDAKVAKDVAAGTVLITSFFSILIGIILFLPHLFSFFFTKS